MDTCFCQKLTDIVGETAVKYQEMMSLHTTFRIGGPADVLVTPPDEKSLKEAICLCQSENVPFLIIGNGSNLLVSDEGIRGVVFQIYRTFDTVQFDTQEDGSVIVEAGAGILLPKLAREIAKQGLEGFEFASGIPGTFGGAVSMNAGAYGGEIAHVIVSAKVLDTQGRVYELQKEELDMGYRSSTVLKNHYIVIGAKLRFKPGNTAQIEQKINELAAMRKEKQPLEYPSAGSTFKRPEGYFAGKLIQDAGLKGYRVGGACVSEKHSGFVVNDDNATAADVYQLIKDVERIVFDKFQVRLEPEVRLLGKFE